MTLPLLIITKDGDGINISSTQQFRCILLDRNTKGVDPEWVTMVAGCPAVVLDSGVQCPNDLTDAWIKQVLADIEADVKCG